MNSSDSTTSIVNSTSSSSSNDSKDVDTLMQSLVPGDAKSIIKSNTDKKEESISIYISQIDDLRQNINQIKSINTDLNRLIHSYEATLDNEKRLIIQRKIAALIERTNCFAAQNRLALQTLKLKYNQFLRENASTSVLNLYSQSYATITHSFIDHINQYQKLQRYYETLLEINYTTSTYLDEENQNTESFSVSHHNQGKTTIQHQLVEACIDSQMQYHEIEVIQKSMKEIHQLFLDLALLVDEQENMIDYIQINIDTTKERANRTERELRNAIIHMKRMRKLKCCLIITAFILLFITGACGVLFVKSVLYVVSF